MALLNGKAAEEIAKEVIQKATEVVKIDISGTFMQKLEALAKYSNRDVIQMRSEKWYESNKTQLISDVIEKLIGDKHKAVTDYMAKKEKDAKMEFFLLLRSKGVSLEEAEKTAGINQL